MAKKDTSTTNPKKPKFSSWWIYGLIAVLLIGFQFLGSSNLGTTKKRPPLNFKNTSEMGILPKS